MKIRQLNMAISRSHYVFTANSMSNILVEHLLKLLVLNSPNDIKGWKDSVKKSFHVDTQNIKGSWKKPVYEHINILTDDYDRIDLRSVKNELDWLLDDSDYLNLPRKSKISELEVANAIIDLIDNISPKVIYTKEAISNIVDEWWNKYKWY